MERKVKTQKPVLHVGARRRWRESDGEEEQLQEVGSVVDEPQAPFVVHDAPPQPQHPPPPPNAGAATPAVPSLRDLRKGLIEFNEEIKTSGADEEEIKEELPEEEDKPTPIKSVLKSVSASVQRKGATPRLTSPPLVPTAAAAAVHPDAPKITRERPPTGQHSWPRDAPPVNAAPNAPAATGAPLLSPSPSPPAPSKPKKSITQEVRSTPRVASFLQYLDEVEAASSTPVEIPLLSLPQRAALPAASSAPASAPAGSLGPVLESVRARISSLEREVERRDKVIKDLEAVVSGLREREKTSQDEVQDRESGIVSRTEQQWQLKLQQQQRHFQGIINKHVQFIDRLMNDKKDLTAKVELLGKQIQELEAQAQKQISDLSKRHAEQLRIEKEKWAALERVSREKWASAKEKELKELTVRGLEPELKKIMAKGEQEVKQVEERCKAEISHEKDFAERTIKRMREQQDQELRDKLRAVEQVHVDEIERLRRNMTQDCDARVQQLRAGQERDRQQLTDQLDQLQASMAQRIARATEDAREEASRKSAAEVAKLKEHMEAEKEQWLARATRKTEQEFAEKEAAIRKETVAQRDKQVEAVVAKLEEDVHAEKAATAKKAREDVARAESRAQVAIAQAQATEKELRDKFVELGKQKLEAEQESQKLRHQLEAVKATRHRDSGTTSQLQEQLRRLSEELEEARKEAARDIQEAKRELEEQKQQHEDDLALKETELEALEERVKKTIAGRDETISALRARLVNEERLRAQLEAELTGAVTPKKNS